MSFTPDIPPLSDSIWPYETGKAPDTSPPQSFVKFRCFVLCPFDRADLVLNLVDSATKMIENDIGLKTEVYYAGDFSGSGSIHPDIWVHVKQADIVVADLTGFNPNVVYELGVAAAWRPLRTVVLMRDESDGYGAAFDLIPARQRLYSSRERGWINQLVQWLAQDIWGGLSQAPFREKPPISVDLPMHVDFLEGKDELSLWSPGPGHRLLTPNGLEFGSIYHFPFSWLSPSSLRIKNLHVRAKMRFSTRATSAGTTDVPWIGIGLRAQGYLANYQHLVWLAWDGRVMRTGPGKNPDDRDQHQLTQLTDFDPRSLDFWLFDIRMDEEVWSIKVENMDRVDIPLVDLPHVYGAGRLLFRAYQCRALISNILIEEV